MNHFRRFFFLVLFAAFSVHPMLAQWVQTNGPYSGDVLSLAVSGTNVFAGTGHGGVWRRSLSEMFTSVERLSTDLPTGLTLSQNYPNPFNQTTVISFGIPSSSFVSLKVFDVLGKEVATLVEGEIASGNHAVTFATRDVTARLYFYKFTAGKFSQTRKAIFAK